MKTDTTTIQLETTPTDSEMFEMVKSGLDPIFKAFKAELKKNDDQTLQIQITRKGGNYKINYGIGDVLPCD